MRVADTSMFRDKLPPFKRVLLFCNISVLFILFSNRKVVICISVVLLYLYVSTISLYFISFPHKSGSSIHDYSYELLWLRFMVCYSWRLFVLMMDFLVWNWFFFGPCDWNLDQWFVSQKEYHWTSLQCSYWCLESFLF